jgi:hypothetical protein
LPKPKLKRKSFQDILPLNIRCERDNSLDFLVLDDEFFFFLELYPRRAKRAFWILFCEIMKRCFHMNKPQEDLESEDGSQKFPFFQGKKMLLV